jgi:hypothetical protein
MKIAVQGSARPSMPSWRSSPTLEYLRDRDRVLGRGRSLPPKPTDAAHDLVGELGLIGALRWLREVRAAISDEIRGGDDDD